MRVFTQRIQISLGNIIVPTDMWLTRRGVLKFLDDFMDRFDAIYPGAIPTTVHPLDYTLVLNPEMYIVGRYWGDETVLSIAQEVSDARNSDPGFQNIGIRSTVITCNDSVHPTQMSLSEVGSAWSDLMHGFADFTIAGYYLGSDPTNFVLLP